MEPKAEKKPTMRNEWFDHVRKTRKKMSRGKNQISHRDAMKAASGTWPEAKAKLIRTRKRKIAKENRKS